MWGNNHDKRKGYRNTSNRSWCGKKLINHIDDEFETIVNAILACNGRVIVTGMGKSGHVGRKIAASLASTGTPSFLCIQQKLSMVI